MSHDSTITNDIHRDKALDKTQALDRFLASVERRAFRIAEMAVNNREEALDIVQDSMFALVRKYSDRPEDEWTPLFYRILQSRIRDWYRKNKTRSKWMSWIGFRQDEHSGEMEDALESLPDPHGRDACEVAENIDSMEDLGVAIKALPLRQQQAFLLRTLEGMSVEQTAQAMSISQGSVKTHYSRAVKSLRIQLEEHK